MTAVARWLEHVTPRAGRLPREEDRHGYHHD